MIFLIHAVLISVILSNNAHKDNVQNDLNCASDWLRYGRYCYLFKIININRENALSSCVINGGSLLSIEDKAENDFIKNQLQSNSLWIGLNDIETEKVFKWTDNTNFGFEDWIKGEPNNFNDEDCVSIGTAGWNDLSCVNTLNGYVCKCRGQGYNCTCKSGFNTSNGGIESTSDQCYDINECNSSTNNNCSANATCNNMIGGYNCTCKSGFNTSNGGIESTSDQCYDINECNSSTNNNCSANATCNNIVGGYNCTCKSGFNTINGGAESTSDQCYDINECNSSTNNNCTANATCNNFVGGYNCTCKSGFNTSNGGIESTFDQCYDINECDFSDKTNCTANATCNNFVGSYNCICKSGFNTSDGGIESIFHKCLDIDECYGSNNNCISINNSCVNEIGTYECIKGEWSIWSECSQTCGHGLKHSVLNEPLLSKKEIIRNKPCTILQCPVDGSWNNWSNWINYTPCLNSCGNCFTRKERSCNKTVPAYGGRNCFGVNFQYSDNNMICQEDGGWGQWTSWSLCNQPCRDGVKTRYRSCSNPLPKYGGLQCNGNNTDQKPCYSGECKEVTVNFGMILPDVNYITDYSTPSNIEYKIQTAERKRLTNKTLNDISKDVVNQFYIG